MIACAVASRPHSYGAWPGRTVQAYLELQRAYAVHKAARANLEAHRGLLSRVSRHVDAGRGNAADNSEALGRTANAEAILGEAQQRIADAHAFFISVAGRPPGKLEAVVVPKKALPGNVEVAVAEARRHAPSVIATEHDASAAEASVGVANAHFMPRLNFELSSSTGWGMTEADDRSIDTRGMFVVRWNLFNGGIDKARVWEAKARALEAIEINENTRRIVERETRVSWNAIRAADIRAPALSKQLRQNRDTRAAYAAQFDSGQRRLLDLLNIQAEVFIAEASLRTEELSRAYNSYRLLAATGRLIPALGLEIPPEAAVPHAPTVLHGWRDGWENWRDNAGHRREQREPATTSSIK